MGAATAEAESAATEAAGQSCERCGRVRGRVPGDHCVRGGTCAWRDVPPERPTLRLPHPVLRANLADAVVTVLYSPERRFRAAVVGHAVRCGDGAPEAVVTAGPSRLYGVDRVEAARMLFERFLAGVVELEAESRAAGDD